MRKSRTKHMIPNELNIKLMEAAKEKIPAGSNLAKMLMDILFLGKEAIYRRLRGEVPFTLVEATIISQKLGISLDKVTGTCANSDVVFDLNTVNHFDPLEACAIFLNEYIKIFHTLKWDPHSEMGLLSNVIPHTLCLKYGLLFKYRLFKWIYQNEHGNCKHFKELEIPQKLIDAQKEFVSTIQYIHAIDYIWDNRAFEPLVNDIHYFSKVHFITDEEKYEMKKELKELTYELESMAEEGKNKEGSKVGIYLSNLNLDTTYSYIKTDRLSLSLIRVYSIHSMVTQDTTMFKILKEWTESLKKVSTRISESNEVRRIQFFKQQREIIDTL